jgi:hypothetical protein
MAVDRYQFSFKTLLVTVAAFALLLGLSTRLAGLKGGTPNLSVGIFLALSGVALPSLGVAAWRALPLDRSLGQVALACIPPLVVCEMEAEAPRWLAPFWAVVTCLVVHVPWGLWCATRRMEPGRERERARRTLRAVLAEGGSLLLPFVALVLLSTL